ncbi:MAG: HAD-IIB family hydrolase [Methylococcales bacterium]|nr:HAD-IIB family hydrolase [Methylococcales bacterium]
MSQRILICTDLDRTLIPNGNLPESPGARQAFARLIARPEITLAYVSGRHRQLVEQAIREYLLPAPAWVIGDVGTTIYQVGAGEWLHWQAWEDDIAASWRGLRSYDLQPLFADLPALELQEENKQNSYKLSYYLLMTADVDALLHEMSLRLNVQNLSASLIYSIDEAADIGLLDVLPARATKLHAVEFLMKYQGFDYANTLFAGDSGNDLPVLASPVKSVLVANADARLAEQAVALAEQQGTLAELYLAQGGFLGMNGHYSAGILEGVGHFFPELDQWLQADHER